MYAYYEQNGLDPFPSIADFFYLIGYFPFALGLILQTKLTKVKLSIKEKIVIIIVYVIIALIVIYGTIIYPIQEVAPLSEEEFLSYFVSALYPICDLMIVFWTLVVYMKLRRGQLNMAWIMLLIGLYLFIIADLFFVWIETIADLGFILQPFDLMYIFAYLAIIISAYNFNKLISK
jgi:hypothetical protein